MEPTVYASGFKPTCYLTSKKLFTFGFTSCPEGFDKFLRINHSCFTNFVKFLLMQQLLKSCNLGRESGYIVVTTWLVHQVKRVQTHNLHYSELHGNHTVFNPS